MGLHFWGEKKKTLSKPGIHLKTDFLIEKHKVSALFWARLSKSLYLYELNTKAYAILQHKGEVGKNVRPSGRDWMESTMASGMPISWIPMSDGWKSISGTAKRSLASLRICSPVLYFPLKTISSLGWWTEREMDQDTLLCNHNPNVFSHLAEAFFDGAEIWKDIIPHHGVFLPLQSDNRRALATQLTSYLIISLSFFLKEDLSKFWAFDWLQSEIKFLKTSSIVLY